MIPERPIENIVRDMENHRELNREDYPTVIKALKRLLEVEKELALKSKHVDRDDFDFYKEEAAEILTKL